MGDCKPVATPSTTSVKLIAAKSDDKEVPQFPYREAVGSLMYLMCMTRPDTAEAVGAVARHVSNPTQQHFMAVKRIFRYLRGTSKFGLTFGPSSDHELAVYSDSDWAGDPNNRRSTSGMVAMLTGDVVAFSSRQQRCVTLSSSEAEYVALSESTKVAVGKGRFVRELLGTVSNGPSPIVVYEDNQSIPTAHG